ncbi:MAG: hypothetical protein HY791_08235 [Deltaproteobacteria bacterium]|nr:hypothetical protein [Deltaproteobacteria bacterium]
MSYLLRILLGLAVLGAGLDAFILLRRRPPISDSDMATAAEVLAESRRPGDVVVVSPLFSMRELAAFRAEVVSPAIPSPETLASRRVLLVDRTDVRTRMPGTPTKRLPIASALELSTYEPSGSSTIVVFDLIADLQKARMSVVRDGHETACVQPRSEGGLGCAPEPEWLYLAPRSLELDGRTVSCVWAHPTTNGVIRIELPAIPAPPTGRKLVLELEGGLTDEAATTPDGASVDATVSQGQARLGAILVPNARGIRRASIPISGDVPARIEVTTARDGRRHFCLNVRIAEGPG